MKINLSLILAALPLLVGCATTNPVSPVAAAVASIHVIVPIAVEYAATQDKNCIPYLTAAAGVCDIALSSGNTTPAQLIAALDASSANSLKTPLAHAAVMSAIGLYEAFLAVNVTSSADATQIISAISSSIRAGLPPNQPSLKMRR